MIPIKDNFLIYNIEKDKQEFAIEHLKRVATHPAFKKEKIRIMPDYHDGKGSVIGFTSTFSDLIIPNVVGVDIGCGVVAYKLGKINNQVFIIRFQKNVYNDNVVKYEFSIDTETSKKVVKLDGNFDIKNVESNTYKYNNKIRESVYIKYPNIILFYIKDIKISDYYIWINVKDILKKL